ncbi:hypothetical protein Dsui_2563 [Azospira oryzae PS]|uniref:Uncharacterized protein n=1 Tax=Azospira oryzae (strain ATCC BAA-33 / DSM 13638 / PS) TaxID=640081 RepID=G8QN74_AZOOP|nr:hypothetical protein [Azospira oryzae]AEV26914.1 hypothetical protein Dsui_2563 [Azospira oryzae PS]
MDHSEYINLLEQDRDNMMEQREEYRLQRDQLLEALEYIAKGYRKVGDMEEFITDSETFQRIARAAIAKATGKE